MLFLTVFQNRRWDGDLLTVRRLIAEGVRADRPVRVAVRTVAAGGPRGRRGVNRETRRKPAASCSTSGAI
jgi:predicted dehydrogenase